MAGGDATATDVPDKYDVVINGKGYILWNALDPNMPFKWQKAQYGYSPTFVTRTNVSGDYGDNQQDFWLTFSQKDWSEGEQQKFYRQSTDQARRFWQGNAIDVRTPGQVTLRSAVKTLTFAGAVQAIHPYRPSGSETMNAASTTNLYEVDYAGAITDRGVHGLGAKPSKYGIVTDAVDTYLSTTTAGTVGVRKWDGAAYSTFSASGADVLEYLNNTLYGLRQDINGDLVRWDTAGTLTSLFTWRQIDGGVLAGLLGMQAYGGKLLIAAYTGNSMGLWIFDGTAPAKVSELPANFSFSSLEVVLGIAFIGGCHVMKDNSGTTVQRPAIYYYANGTLGLLWEADTTVVSSAFSASPGLAPIDGGLVFNDDTTGRLMFYDLKQGGPHAIGTYTVGTSGPTILAASATTLLMTRNQTTSYQYPDVSTKATSGYVVTSLTDYDSSLDKYFKAVKIDADIPTGASIDIAYQIGDVASGSFTTAQTGAASGTEYSIGASGRSISIKVTLNKGSSTNGPTLKRIYVRAAPLQQTFRQRQYILDCTGAKGKTPVMLRDGTTPSPLTGLQMAANLNTAATLTTPFSITDEFGTFTGLIEPDKFELDKLRPGEYIARVAAREV